MIAALNSLCNVYVTALLLFWNTSSSLRSKGNKRVQLHTLCTSHMAAINYISILHAAATFALCSSGAEAATLISNFPPIATYSISHAACSNMHQSFGNKRQNKQCAYAILGFRDRLVPACMISVPSPWLTCPSISCCPCCCIGHTGRQGRAVSDSAIACTTSSSRQMVCPAVSSLVRYTLTQLLHGIFFMRLTPVLHHGLG